MYTKLRISQGILRSIVSNGGAHEVGKSLGASMVSVLG